MQYVLNHMANRGGGSDRIFPNMRQLNHLLEMTLIFGMKEKK